MGGGRTFGLTSATHTKRGRGTFKRRGGFGGGGRGSYSSGGGSSNHASGSGSNSFGNSGHKDALARASADLASKGQDEATLQEQRFDDVVTLDRIDTSLGFERIEQGAARQAWLVSMHPTLIKEDSAGGNARGKAGVDFYFIEDDAGSFKVTMLYQPYFFLACRPSTESSVEEWLLRRYEGYLNKVERVWKEDLKLPNHLVGHQRLFLKCLFDNATDLLDVRRDLLPLVTEAKAKLDAVDAYADALYSADLQSGRAGAGEAGGGRGGGDGFGAGADPTMSAMDIFIEDETDTLDDQWTGGRAKNAKGKATNDKGRGLDPQDCIVDLREYDVPYYLRVAIDKGEHIFHAG